MSGCEWCRQPLGREEAIFVYFRETDTTVAACVPCVHKRWPEELFRLMNDRKFLESCNIAVDDFAVIER